MEASDVFTCGLILYELLGGKQPLYHLDDADYLKEIDSRSTLKPTLLGRMGRDRPRSLQFRAAARRVPHYVWAADAAGRGQDD